ncbi:twin-arginine translocase subunit TatC [bacterium]|nr:twin-arginine translocase subunit TatC [bacterium]
MPLGSYLYCGRPGLHGGTLNSRPRDEKRMPFLEHLEELRWRILKSLAVVVILSIVAYIFSKDLLNLLIKPVPPDIQLIFITPTGAFLVSIKVAIIFGLMGSLPVIFYQTWQFIFPGLLKSEIKMAVVLVLSATVCFLLGATFAFFVILPFGLRFLFSFQTVQLVPMPDISSYIGFAGRLFLAFGIVFELPLLSFILSKMGVLTPAFMRRQRRYAVVVIFIAAAILTPPDVITQVMLATPLILLYEISVWISAAVCKAQKQKGKTTLQKAEKADE